MLVPFLIITLAVWRVTYLILNEQGPADMFGALRRLVGAEKPGEPKPGSLAKLFTCFYCMSVWVSFFPSCALVGYYFGSGSWLLILGFTFAFSAAAMFVNVLWERNA